MTNLSVTKTGSDGFNAGGLVGTLSASTVTNVQLSGAVQGNTYIGGLAGQVINQSTISKSSFTGTVTSTTQNGAGFVAILNNSNITDSYANATVSGLTGDAGFVSNMQNLVGNSASISNSYAVGTVTEGQANNPVNTGGFINEIGQPGTGTPTTTVDNSFSVVSGSNGTNFQVAPINSNFSGTPSVSGFYYSGDDAKTNWCGGFSCTAVNADGSDASHFKNTPAVAPLLGWDFTNTWQTVVGGYPILRDNASLDTLPTLDVPGVPSNLQASKYTVHTTQFTWNSPTTTGGSDVSGYVVKTRPHTVDDSGEITEHVFDTSDTSGNVPLDPGDYDYAVAAINAVGQGDYTSFSQYTVPPLPDPEISSCEDLQNIANEPSGDYYLTQSFSCDQTSTWNPDGDGGYYGFAPIFEFSGTLDGNGFTVDGLYINRPSDCGIGIFSVAYDDAYIANLTLQDVSITGACETGGLIGDAYGSVTVDSVNINGMITANSDVGGLIGYADADTGFSISGSEMGIGFFSSDGPQQDYGGLIGNLYTEEGAQVDIQNNTIQNDTSNTNGAVIGGIVGYTDMSSASIATIADNDITTTSSCFVQCGGVMGYVEGYWNGEGDRPELHVDNTTVQADIMSAHSVGDLIGEVYATGLDTSIYQSSYSLIDNGIQSFGENAGGLVGYVYDDGYDSTLNISESSARGPVVGAFEGFEQNDNVGGLVGKTEMYTEISNSYFAGDAVSYGEYGGGLVGRSTGYLAVFDSYASGDFTGAFLGPAGGLVGGLENGLLVNSVAHITTGIGEGSIIGGAVGEISGTLDGDSNVYVDVFKGMVPNCYGTQEDDYTCHLVNDNEEDVSFNPDYFIGNRDNDPLSSWNFDDVWAVEDSDMPVLAWQSGPVIPPVEVDPEISSCEQLQQINYNLVQDYELVADIDCSDTINWNSGEGFVPLGDDSHRFTGTLDGAGHTISGLYINLPENDYVGLFGYISGADVTNLTIQGNISGRNYVGGVAGYIENSTINNVHADVDVYATDSYAGGLVGNDDSSEVSDSSAAGSITSEGERAGGLIGATYNCNIFRNFATGDVTISSEANIANNNSAGGLIGVSTYDNVIDNYARGNVSALNYYAGGLIGSMNTSYVARSYATGDVTSSYIVGGLIGYTYGPSQFFDSFTISRVSSSPNGVYISDEQYTNGFIGNDHYGEGNYVNSFYNSDNERPCSMTQAYDEIDGGGCQGVSIEATPTRFMFADDAPLDSWTNMGEDWHIQDSDYPNLSPSDSPEILCEQTSVTTTTIHVYCDSSPHGWGQPLGKCSIK